MIFSTRPTVVLASDISVGEAMLLCRIAARRAGQSHKAIDQFMTDIERAGCAMAAWRLIEQRFTVSVVEVG